MKSLFPFILVFLTACDLCGNDVVEEKLSPDGKYIATAFVRDCGATTSFVGVVSLRPADEGFEPDDNENWVFSIYGQTNVGVEWESNKDLLVDYTHNGDVSRKDLVWKDININYQ